MKAALYTEYGSPQVVNIKEIPLPEAEENEVLVRVIATTVSSADSRVRAMRIPPGFKLLSRLIFGFSRPKNPILGSEFAGIVENTGESVTQFKPGDKVFGAYEKRGTHAEFFAIQENDAIEHLPDGFSFEEAASLPFGALTSLIFLKDMGRIQSGQKILIIGASGSLGTAAVQLAKHFGAQVTGVCSTANVELVRSLGADRVIDYTKTDFTKEEERYDLIYETVGKVSFADCKKALKNGGSCLMAVASIPDYFRMLANPIAGNKKLVSGVALFTKDKLTALRELMQAGAIKAVIDCIYPLDSIKEAHARVDTGHKRGSVVVKVTDAVYST